MTDVQPSRRTRLLVSVIALSLGLAACGGASDPDSTPEPSPTTVGPNTTSSDDGVESGEEARATSPEPSGPDESGSDVTGGGTGEPADGSSSGADASGERTEGPTATDAVAVSQEDRFSCGASPVVATDWPFYVSEWIQISDLAVDGTRYALAGVTSDLNAVLSDSLSRAFVGFDVVERDPERTSLTLDLTSDGVTVMLHAEDEGQTGCWSVEIVAEYDRAPAAAEQPAPSGGTVPAPIRGVGNVVVMTPRGDFDLNVEACRISPIFVDASSADGELRMRSTSDDGVAVQWTYADGAVVVDAAAQELYANEISRGVAIANGTVFIEVAC